MPYRKQSRHAAQLLWVLLAVILMAMGAALHYLHREIETQTLRRAEGDAGNLARAFAEHTLASFQRVDFVLRELRREWLARPAEFRETVARRQAEMENLTLQVAIIGADGHLDFSNLSPGAKRIDLSDREHFRIPHEMALRGEDRLFVSRPVKGRVSGKWSIQIVRPIVDAGKIFRGVLVISVNPKYFGGFYGSVDLGAGSAIVMVRDSGEILSRDPELEGSIGKVLTGTPYLVPNAPIGGTFRRRAQVDGTERIYGYHREPQIGVTLVVGLGADDVLAELRQKQRWEWTGAALLGAVMTLLVLVIRRAQKRQFESERRFRALFESFTDMVFVLDRRARLLMAHMPAGEAPACSCGVPRLGESLAGTLPAEAVNRIETAIAGSGRSRFDFRCNAGGTLRDCQAILSPLHGQRGDPNGVLLVVRDVTAERSAAESLRIAATTFESQEGMMITDERGTILRVNRAFSELTGYAADEVVGQTPSLLKSGRQGDAFYREMWATLIRDGYWQGEVWNRRKSGEVYPEWLTISAVVDDDRRTTHYVGAFSDISERKEAEMRIRNLAFYDPLTQLPNRRLLLDRLHQALASGRRQHAHGALLYLDLDHFKMLNDTRGHDAGDDLLIEVASRLRAAVREEDTVSRLGGDEFVVMLENLDPSAPTAASRAERVAEKIRSALNHPFALKGGAYTLSSSIGVCLFRGDESDVRDILKQADMALYEAKESGRNAIRFFSHTMQAAVDERAHVVSGLRQALHDDQFELHLQAQFDTDGRRIGAECLLRWRHPQRGLVPPDEFIPLAEESGLIVGIGHWVLDRACALLAERGHEFAGQCLSINVSALQFQQPDFVATVTESLARHAVDGRRLCIELTESALLGDVDAAAEKMEELKATGVMISLDDFGTGYSSLSFLKRLPIDEVKIDRSFVMDIGANAQEDAIVHAIVVMCHSLGLTVIAEGVETQAQRDYLAACGCDALQGFLLARPAPEQAYR